MNPYDVCAEYAKQKEKLTIQTYSAVDSSADMVLIEGEAEALEFLGNIFLAHAKYEKGCEFEMGPNSSGNALFNKKASTHGIYIHRLPCLEERGLQLAKPRKIRQ